MLQAFLAAAFAVAQLQSPASAVLPVGEPRALEALPDTTVHYYEVSGTSLAAINGEIAAKAPRDPATGLASSSSAEWSVGLKVEEEAIDDRCIVTAAQASFSASVVLPRLANEEMAPGDLRRVWRQYISNLEGVHAAELRFVVQRLGQLENAVIGSHCDEANRLASASAEIIQNQLGAFSRSIRKAPLSLRVPVRDPHDPR